MDSDEETKSFKFMAGAVLVFIMSWVGSCQELKYALWKKTASADVVSLEEVMVSVRAGYERKYHIVYTYDDSGKTVKVDKMYPDAWDMVSLASGGTIRIEYLAGDNRSARLEGESNLVPVAFFLLMLGVVIFYIIKFIRDAKRPY